MPRMCMCNEMTQWAVQKVSDGTGLLQHRGLRRVVTSGKESGMLRRQLGESHKHVLSGRK